MSYPQLTLGSDHWLKEVKQVPSPFYNQRPESTEHKLDISLLVLHHISLPPRQFGGPYIEQLFTGTLDPNAHPFFESIQHLKVSAHCLIRRDGEIIQFVPFDGRAWHAGQSSFAGRAGCNDYSIGIELEGSELDAYTHAQYTNLAKLTDCLLAHYPQITQERITGHQYIAPLRKPDPGLTFNWSYFRSLLNNCNTNE
ncbi:MAG: 1,6-anhydro-N-acetylmuramyl-L-alanine amidase AmpD [Vibrio sp.]